MFTQLFHLFTYVFLNIAFKLIKVYIIINYVKRNIINVYVSIKVVYINITNVYMN